MSASTFTQEEICKIRGDISRYRYEYHNELKRRLSVLLDQNPNSNLRNKLDRINQKITNIEERHYSNEHQFQQDLESASSLAWNTVFNKACFEEYAELFPKFLETLTSICEEIKELYLSGIDADIERKSKLYKKQNEIEDLIRTKSDAVFEQKVASLKERISRSPFDTSIEYDGDYVEFVKTLNPKLYDKCMEIYECYQRGLLHDTRLHCHHCSTNLTMSKALRIFDHVCSEKEDSPPS